MKAKKAAMLAKMKQKQSGFLNKQKNNTVYSKAASGATEVEETKESSANNP